jgi:hypothetical protein
MPNYATISWSVDAPAIASLSEVFAHEFHRNLDFEILIQTRTETWWFANREFEPGFVVHSIQCIA